MIAMLPPAPRRGNPRKLGFSSLYDLRHTGAMTGEHARRRCRERILELAYRPADAFRQRFEIIELLRPVVGFERWCWPACDPASGLATTAVGDHDYWQALPRLLLL